ncbi:hypothetical protein C7S16_6910 [Burkholderia thailandensis]|uniref:Uncharacterized protein n=1 Tax=Burkholderia thailandensis TaxID=57975 RepID=A0AAW9CT17_BURTH|nr:hypothetical protein [Burkholderia thailandensis]
MARASKYERRASRAALDVMLPADARACANGEDARRVRRAA